MVVRMGVQSPTWKVQSLVKGGTMIEIKEEECQETNPRVVGVESKVICGNSNLPEHTPTKLQFKEATSQKYWKHLVEDDVQSVLQIRTKSLSNDSAQNS